jgi:hypothetical protein
MQHGKDYININGAIAGAPRKRGLSLEGDKSAFAMHRLRRHYHRLASSQNRCRLRYLRITGPQLARFQNQFALQQVLGVSRRQPTPIFRDADGHHFIFIFVNRLKNGSRRKQRDFMLAAASSKQNSDPKLFHISVQRR